MQDGRAVWDGVRNYAARNNLRAMRRGDEVFFYHSNEGLQIVGVAKVVKEAYQDPTTEDPAWVAVDLKPVRALKKPVTLAMIKATPSLKEMQLLGLGRLSVSAVTDNEFAEIMAMENV